jgi:hypothetical protein
MLDVFAQLEIPWDRVVQAIVLFFCTTVLSFFIGRWWGNYRARKQWESREFTSRFQVSLNIFQDNTLKIRTLFERPLHEVFINPMAVAQVQAASLQTTPDNPILGLNPSDRRFLMTFVINAISECFRDGLVRHDAGEKMRTVTYLVFLTCEVLDETMFRKVRAMMLRKEVMDNFPYMETLPKLERDKDQVRMKALRQAVAIYQAEPDLFHPIEIYI